MIKRARGGEFGNEEERREEERLVSRDIKFRRDTVGGQWYIKSMAKSEGECIYVFV